MPAIPLPKSKWLDAVVAMNRESQAASKKGNLAQMLEAQSKLQFTPETSKLLLEVFGSEHPLNVKRAPGNKGRLRYVVEVAPHGYQDTDGLKVEWDELLGSVDIDHAGRNAESSFVWPSLAFDGPKLHVGLRAMSIESKQSLGADGLWYGSQHARIGSMTFGDLGSLTVKANVVHTADDDGSHSDVKVDGGVEASKAAPGSPAGTVRMEGIDYKGVFSRHGKFSDYSYLGTIDRISAGDALVDHVNVGVRVLHMDPAALKRLKTGMEQLKQDGQTNEQVTAAFLPLIKDAGKSLIKQGAELVIDDFSASYHGNSASLKGRVGFGKVEDKDFDEPMSLLKKMVAHFDVRVSLKLVQDVARYVAGKQLAATLGQRPAQEDIDRSAKDVASGMMDKAVAEGFVRIEDGELRMTVDYKDGKLAINGKSIPLPNLGASAPHGAGNLVPPSEPKGRCGWPALPADAPKAELTLQMNIDTAGHASGIGIVHGSGYAEYDALSIAAAADCAWLPGRVAGKRTAMPLTWANSVTRPVAKPEAVAPAGAPRQ